MNKRFKLTLVLFQDVKREWRWHAIRNKRILFCSSESYKSLSSMKKVLRNSLFSLRGGDYAVLFDSLSGKPVDLGPRF